MIINAEFQSEYDKKAIELGWVGPEVLFGLSYEFVNDGQNLLDLGIGTGLSSMPFYLAGLDIYGIDDSPDMLILCEQKKFAKDLVCQDILEPLPYQDNFFDHIVSCGFFHLIENIDPILNEISRVLKPNGYLLYTMPEDINKLEPFDQDGVYYKHEIHQVSNFDVIKKCKFQGYSYKNEDVNFSAYVTRKKGFEI